MPFVSDLLTATPATVDGNPTPNRTWQWLRGSTPISGATSNTYTVQEADIGETISVRQTETNLLGSASALSLATAIVTVAPDAYAIGGNSPELAASFLTQEDGTTEGEYFRTGGATDDFTMFTFSRASNATMFDSTGTLKWAPHNLMPSTDNSTEDTRCTITGGQSVTAVLGLTEARLFTQSTGTTEIFHVTRYDLTGAVLGQTYTSSYIVKAGTAPYVFVTHWNTPNARHYSISVDLSDGSVVDTSSSAWTGSHNVEGLGNGYYKIDVTSTSFNIPHLSFSIGFSATSTLHAYGLVYEDGTGVTGYILAEHLYRSDLGGMADNPDQPAGLEKYVPTTSAAVYLPRRNAYYYNGTAWTKGGLQLESEAATNLHATSRGFSSWSGTAGTSRTLNAIGIDGVSNTAATLTNTSGGTHYFFLDTTVAADTSTYVASVCVKKAVSPATYPGIRVQAPALYDYLLDHENGVMVKRGSSSTAPATYVEDLGDYWRFSIQSVNNGVNTLHRVLIFPSVDTDNDDTWAATAPIGSAVFDQTDLVVNAVPTSYIPTYGSTVTRAAETLSIASSNLPITATEYSFSAKTLITRSNNPEMFHLGAGSFWHRVYPRSDSPTRIQSYGGSAKNYQPTAGSPIPNGINVPFRFATAMKANDTFQLAVNGTAGATVATTDIYDISTQNMNLPGTTPANGPVFFKELRVWSVKLSEAGLEEVST